MHEFEAADVSVLEAVGKTQGLLDNRSDPEGIFLMRFEPATTSYQLVGQENPGDPRQVVPTIYRFDLEDPNQYFFAQVIGLRDKDILYVANARSVEVSKVMAMFRGAIGAASLATSFGRTAVTLGE